MGPKRAALLVVIISLGLVGSAASLTPAIEVTFDDDPILRLATLQQNPPVDPDPARCGLLLADADVNPEPLSLTGLARDRACRESTTRRRGIATAAALLVLALGIATVATSSRIRTGGPPRSGPKE